MKKKLVAVFILIIFIICCQNKAFSFTRIIDLVFDGESVEPDKFQEVLQTIKINKQKNKSIKNPKKLKPDKLFIVKAKQPNPKNIQIEIDTSQVVVKSEDDVQAGISNPAFLNAVTEAVQLWDDIEEANVTFAPLKFASSQADPLDGKNVVTFRAIEDPEGVPDGTSIISIVNYTRTNTVVFMDKVIMVKPGTILDTDIIYDPTNNPCLALHTTKGSFVDGGDDDSPIVEGGVDSTLSAEDLQNCKVIVSGDLTDLAVSSIGSLLGLDSSAIASSATSLVGKIMTRYALTNDDKIGLTNIYPDRSKLTNHGIVSGKVILNKKPVKGAHVVLEDTTTGEPITSTITDLFGKFLINFVPTGSYNIYAEPIDGPIRKNVLRRNFFGFLSDLNFTTMTLVEPITVSINKRTNVIIEVKELAASAFNINYLTTVLTEKDVNAVGGGFILPISIMPGETITDVQFWGSNISPDFGTLSISGMACTVSNIREDVNISISPFMGDPPPDVLPGIKVDITCNDDAAIGPRNIIFTGNQLDPTHPSFGLRDQITGGLFVAE